MVMCSGFTYLLSVFRVTPRIIQTQIVQQVLCPESRMKREIYSTSSSSSSSVVDEGFYGSPSKPRRVGWLFPWRAEALWSWKCNDVKRLRRRGFKLQPALSASLCLMTLIVKGYERVFLEFLIKTNRRILNEALVSSSELWAEQLKLFTDKPINTSY